MLKSFNKTDRRILITAIIILLLFSYLLYDDSFFRNWQKSSRPVVAKLISVENDVRQKNAAEFQWDNVRKSRDIHYGDSIFTGDESFAWIELEDGSQFYIEANSLIVFNMTAEQLQLALKFGSIGGQINGFLNLDGLDLCGKDADFKVTANGNGQYDVQNSKGGLYTNCDTKPRLAKKSNARVPASNDLKIIYPAAKSTILVPIDDLGVPKETNAVQIKWRHNKISRYEVQLAKDVDFKNIISTQHISAKSLASPALEEGAYFVRVRDVNLQDTNWSQVTNFQIKYSLPAKLKAPELTLPNIVYRVPNKRPLRISWQPVVGASSYEVAISNSPEFTQKVSFAAKNTTFKLEQFEAGKFFYRVTSISKIGGTGASSIGRLTIISDRPVLDSILPKSTKAKDEEDEGEPTDFRVGWTENPLAKSYQVEVATTSDFANAQKYESTKPSSVVNVPKVGNYYWRVRPLDKRGKPLSGYSDNGMLNYNFADGPLPPKLIEPMDNMTLFFQRAGVTPFWLEWKSSKQAAHYIIEIAADKDFSQVVLNQQLNNPRLLLSTKMPEGIMYWRVKAISSDDKESRWSDIRSFQLFSGRAPASE